MIYKFIIYSSMQPCKYLPEHSWVINVIFGVLCYGVVDPVVSFNINPLFNP